MSPPRGGVTRQVCNKKRHSLITASVSFFVKASFLPAADYFLLAEGDRYSSISQGPVPACIFNLVDDQVDPPGFVLSGAFRPQLEGEIVEDHDIIRGVPVTVPWSSSLETIDTRLTTG